MRVFVAVSGGESLSAAARRLGMPLTTVSRHLAALEDRVGATLVARTTRRLDLTDAGRDYLEACKRVLDEIDTAQQRLSGSRAEPHGELSITAPIVFGRLHVLPVVTAFLRQHDQVNARMLLMDRSVDLIEEGLDVAVRIGPLPDSALIATRVGSVRLVACASPAYLKAHGTPQKPEDLTAHDCITFASLPSRDTWSFKSSRATRRIRVRPRLAVNTVEAAVDAATAGLGITRVLSYQAAAAIKSGALREILAGNDSTEFPVHGLHRYGRQPQAKVQMFLTFAAQRLRKSLSAVGTRRDAR